MVWSDIIGVLNIFSSSFHIRWSPSLPMHTRDQGKERHYSPLGHGQTATHIPQTHCTEHSSGEEQLQSIIQWAEPNSDQYTALLVRQSVFIPKTPTCTGYLNPFCFLRMASVFSKWRSQDVTYSFSVKQPGRLWTESETTAAALQL